MYARLKSGYYKNRFFPVIAIIKDKRHKRELVLVKVDHVPNGDRRAGEGMVGKIDDDEEVVFMDPDCTLDQLNAVCGDLLSFYRWYYPVDVEIRDPASNREATFFLKDD